MKKIQRILGLLLLTGASLGASAQVDNYALNFTDGSGVANLGKVTELSHAQDYTLQLWFNPAAWTQGAALVRCGSFSIKLGVEHALVINDGTNHFSLTTSALAVGKWAHLTLRTNAQGTVVTVNNSQKFSCAQPMALPAAEKSIWLGGDFIGRIDEVRLWKGQLPEDYSSFWQNTLNDLIPSWDALLAYWKLDQEQCAHIVDYRGTHHGTLSPSGVSKAKVTDNDSFRYRINLAYGDIARFFDRKIDARHYSLSNRIAVIGGHFNQYTNTHYLAMEREDAELGSATWLASFSGRKGVVQLNGGDGLSAAGSVLEVGSAPKEQRKAPAGYAFETWIYLDEITPDATLFSKGSMAITLTESGALAIALGSQTVTSKNTVPVGQWAHVGVSASGTSVVVKIGADHETLTSPAAFAPTINSSRPVIGKGVKGKLDDVMIWAAARTASEMASDAQRVPLADAEHSITGNSAAKMAACYMFDLEAEPGYDAFSVDQCFRTMRSYTEGMRGVKYLLSLGANNFQTSLANATLRQALGEKLARMVDDDLYDGLDLDFEWPENATQWNNVGLLCQVIRQNLKAGKELSVSPHYSYYLFPQARMADVDFFNFQIYGPNNPTLFTRNGYSAAVTNFRNQGFSDDKIVMSYATTTSGGYTESGSRVASSHKGYSPVGYAGLNNNSLEGGVPADATRAYHSGNECWYYLTAFDQTVWRAQYAVENGLGGIMYWDMGNDLPATQPLSLARGASYALNSNVEPLVTSVASAAPAPADDAFAPTETEDPDDQGGFDANEAQAAIADALAHYAQTVGYPAASSAERAALLAAINRAHVGQADGASVAGAVADYLASQPSAIGGPRNGAIYNIVCVNSYDGARRYLYAQSNGTVNVAYNPTDTSADKYRWTVKVNADGAFMLADAEGRYLTDKATVSDEASAYAFALVPGLKLGRIMLQRSSDGWYLNTHYNEANVAGDMVTEFNSAAADGDNPKKWSAQWIFEEINPQLLVPYSVTTDGEGGVKTPEGVALTHSDTYYVDPDASTSDFMPLPTDMTNGSIAFNHTERTISATYFGLSVRKAYRLQSNSQKRYLTINDDKELKGLDLDAPNPQQIFNVTRMSDTKFSLQAQGVYVGTPATQAVNVVASETPVDFYVVRRDADECYAFDWVKPNGGTWADGSKALMCNAEGDIIPWGTGTVDAWWTAEEVSEYTLPMQQIGSAYYAAVCLPFGFALPDEATAFDVVLSGSVATLSELSAREFAPQTPVLLISSAPSVTLSVVHTNAETATSLQGNLFAQAAPSGAYVLALSNGSPAFVLSTSLPRNTAYLTATDTGAQAIPLENLEDIITSISADEINTKATTPAAVYDLQGRRRSAPVKGINIVNGQKVIVP